jgi:formylmethanofuran dehydrogenase subunit B
MNTRAVSVVCGGCNLYCDDIRKVATHHRTGSDGERTESDYEYQNACELGRRYFQVSERQNAPSYCVNGVSVDCPAAAQKAVELLRAAKYPLITGLQQISVESQQIALAISQKFKTVVDPSLNSYGRSATYSLARRGAVTATLGEVKDRAKLVVFWGCDPVRTHPRLRERFCSDARVIVVDSRLTESARVADRFIQILDGADESALAVCEAVLRNCEFETDAVDRQTGCSVQEWRELVNQITDAVFVAVFYSTPDLNSEEFNTFADRVAAFVQASTGRVRIVSIPLLSNGNALGAENVTTWQTGFPTAVDRTRPFARYHYGEYSTSTLLQRNECDAAMVFVSDGSQLDFGDNRRAALDRIPKIVVSCGPIPVAGKPWQARQPDLVEVFDPTIGEGDVCRLDDLMIRMRRVRTAKINAGQFLTLLQRS